MYMQCKIASLFCNVGATKIWRRVTWPLLTVFFQKAEARCELYLESLVVEDDPSTFNYCIRYATSKSIFFFFFSGSKQVGRDGEVEGE